MGKAGRPREFKPSKTECVILDAMRHLEEKSGKGQFRLCQIVFQLEDRWSDQYIRSTLVRLVSKGLVKKMEGFDTPELSRPVKKMLWSRVEKVEESS